MKRKLFHPALWLLFIFFGMNQQVKAQILDSENKLSITLSDGTQLTLFGQASNLSDAKTKNYYYLPNEPRLAMKPDGTPQFLFLKYMSDKEAKEGGISGAILHMLMEWGLTPKQTAELDLILKNGEQGAPKESILKGAVDVSPDGDKSFKVISATLSDGTLAPAVVTSSKAPVLPGSKIAVAVKLDANGAQLLAATFEKARSITDLSIELNFKYTVRMPAAKGRAIINWSKMYTQYKQDSASYKETTATKSRGGLFGGICDALFGKQTEVTSRTYDEMHKFIETMIEKEYIKLDWDENMSDERITKMRESFFEYFLEKMAATTDEAMLTQPSEKEQEAMPNIKYGKKYTYNRTYFESNFQKKTQIFRFDARLAVDKYFSVTGNLASWYDGVKNNKKCVGEVYLNDPFYEHKDINFVLDLDAEKIFNDEVNYVTVNVRKKRSSGADFTNSLTIDRAYLKENGISGVISYARGDDKNSDVYEYKTQWSLRGGNLYPEDPAYMKGDWEGVTLYPPIVPRKIEFEADLGQLGEIGITRATLQLRYYKYGKEVETNIPMTVSKGEALVESTIYMDKDTQGYAYRLVLNHKDAKIGKMALDWDVKINDDYVYASIPDELLDKNDDFIDKAIDAAKSIIEPNANGEVDKTNVVLDKFKDLLKVVN
jgi:hypothetical protein